MYYKLREELCLRSYQKLPYCVLIRPENQIQFVRKEVFEALSFCTGEIDTELFLVPQHTKKIIKDLAKLEYVIPCEKGDIITEDQKLKKYDNRYIKTVHWSITGKCNYRCRHCYMSAPDAKLGELSHIQVMDLIEQIDDCGIHAVSITGGEPLIRRDFEEIVSKLTEKKIKITHIYSNGKLVNSELLDMLERYHQNPIFDMSYDGDEGWHDWLRGIEGASKIVLDAFDLCYERGFHTQSEMCLHQGNKHLLRKSLNTLAKHHVEACKTNPVAPTEAWTKTSSEDYTLSMKETFDIYVKYIPKYFADNMPISLMLGGAFRCEQGSESWTIPLKRYDNTEECLRQTVCGHARNVLYLSPESRMLPCLSLSSTDLQKDYPLAIEIGLKEGLKDSTYMSLIDTRIEEFFEINQECNSCEHKLICGGGCRASALTYEEDNIMASDKACCMLFKGGYEQKITDAANLGLKNRKGTDL